MQRVASSTKGSGRAPVGQASRQAVQLPHMSVRGVVGSELEVGHELAQEEPRPVLGMEQAGVLAPGPEAGRGGVGPLHDGPRVHVGATLERAGLRPQRARPAAASMDAHHVVVVVAPGVAADPPVVLRRLGRVRGGRCRTAAPRTGPSGPRGRRRAGRSAGPPGRSGSASRRRGRAPPIGEGRKLPRRVGPGDAREVEAAWGQGLDPVGAGGGLGHSAFVVSAS